MKAAFSSQIVPRDLFGKAQFKTLHARLATDILRKRSSSEFFRTAPGRFFLRELQSTPGVPARFRREYSAPLRAAQLGHFDIAAFSRIDVRRCASPIRIEDLLSLPWRYHRLETVRKSASLVALRFVVVLIDSDRVLLLHNALIEHGEMRREVTLGLLGLVKRDDRSLFSRDAIGLIDAAIRTIAERLDVVERDLEKLNERQRWSETMIFYEESSAQQPDDLMALITVSVSGVSSILRQVEKDAGLSWTAWPLHVNDLDDFDRWSHRFLLPPARDLLATK